MCILFNYQMRTIDTNLNDLRMENTNGLPRMTKNDSYENFEEEGWGRGGRRGAQEGENVKEGSR